MQQKYNDRSKLLMVLTHVRSCTRQRQESATCDCHWCASPAHWTMVTWSRGVLSLSHIAVLSHNLKLFSETCVSAGGGGGSRQIYTYETLLQYADSPLSKPPPAGLAAFPAELARKVTPRRAPFHLACPPHPPALPLHRLRSAWPPLHHPNYLAALLCRNFYWRPGDYTCSFFSSLLTSNVAKFERS